MSHEAWRAARKGVIFLAGDADAVKQIEPLVKGFSDRFVYFSEFGGASKVKLINKFLVGINIAAAAEAVALFEVRCRHQRHDRGSCEWQRRIDAVRHPRAVDGTSPVQAGSRIASPFAALRRPDRQLGGLNWRGDVTMIDVINALSRERH